MKKPATMQQLWVRSRRLPWLVIGLALVVLGGTIFAARQQLRTKVREQIIGRDGQVLHAVAQMHLAEETAAGDAVPDLAQQFVVVLKTSRLGGVMGARLFDRDGKFLDAFDADVLEADLNPTDLPALKRLQPVSRFDPAVRFSKNFLAEGRRATDLRTPLLEVNVPLHARQSGRLIGIAQFLIEGESVAAEFQRLDRHLNLQSLVAFGVSGAVLSLALGWSFRRLQTAHEMLATRGQQLIKANQELALAAKTSALGAVSAHLIHGLKNPLSGLQNFVAGGATADLEDWEQAVVSTRRMQAIINEVVNVLREEEGGAGYEVTLAELAGMITTRIQPMARESGVTFLVHRDGEAVLPNRVANLLALILVNLVQNGLQNTPRDGAVCLRFRQEQGALICEVWDEGPGLPDEVKTELFVPCRSTRKGGSGIGLAISKQLANHLGAELELKSSTRRGCVFSLTLPLARSPGAMTMEASVRT